jgi:hypothetical protein
LLTGEEISSRIKRVAMLTIRGIVGMTSGHCSLIKFLALERASFMIISRRLSKFVIGPARRSLGAGGPEFLNWLLECSGNGSLDPTGFSFFVDHERNPRRGNPVFAGNVSIRDPVENH